MSPLVVASFRALSRGFGVFFGRSVSHVYRDTRHRFERKKGVFERNFLWFFFVEDFFLTRPSAFFVSRLRHEDGEISKRFVLFERFQFASAKIFWRKHQSAFICLTSLFYRLFSTTTRVRKKRERYERNPLLPSARAHLRRRRR